MGQLRRTRRPQSFDLIVLGGGNSAGLVQRAGAAGLRTAVIDPGPLGGTCPNRGCIPSKILLQHATVAETVRRAGKFHIRARLGAIDSRRILAATREDVASTHDDVLASFGRHVKYFPTRGEFVSARVLRAGDALLTAPRIVVATGTRPVRPPAGPPGIVSDDIFRLREAPAKLVIVGGGFIACELAHFFAGIGTEVTMVVRGDKLLPAEDADVSRTFQKAFAPRVDLRLGTTLDRVKAAGKTILYAIGRRPNTDAIGAGRAGLALDDRGFIRADDCLRTSVPGVYALGDVNGRHQFTHAATAQVEYLARRLIDGRRGPIDHGPMPHAVFTDPEIGSVGATEQELRAKRVRYLKALVPYSDTAKGYALKVEHGFAKLLASPRGEILGFHAIGPEASILLHEVVQAMRWRNHVSSLTEAVTVHPSLNEVVAEAAWQIVEKLPGRSRRRRAGA